MQQLVSELEGPVVLSDRALRQLARVRDARRAHLQRHRREPSRAELAARVGIARDQVERLIAAERKPRALEEPVGGEADAGSTFADLLADPSAEDSYDRVLGRVERPQLQPLLDELDARERWIVTERFGLEGPVRTLRELACVLGVSAERVRQVEQVALNKLRAAVLGSDVDVDPTRSTLRRQGCADAASREARSAKPRPRPNPSGPVATALQA
jgi:RNA polymerase primary sigma factor